MTVRSLVLVACLGLARCGGSDDPAAPDDVRPTPMVFEGVMSGPLDEVALINLELSRGSMSGLRGSLEGSLQIRRGDRAPETPVPLDGQVDDAAFVNFGSGQLASPPLGRFTCSARIDLDLGLMRGDCIGQDGIVRRLDLRSRAGGEVERFCGVWRRDVPPGELGTWVVVLQGSSAGAAYSAPDHIGAGLGTHQAGRLDLNLEPNGEAMAIVADGEVRGQFEVAGIGAGTFEASQARCP